MPEQMVRYGFLFIFVPINDHKTICMRNMSLTLVFATVKVAEGGHGCDA